MRHDLQLGTYLKHINMLLNDLFKVKKLFLVHNETYLKSILCCGIQKCENAYICEKIASCEEMSRLKVTNDAIHVYKHIA